jgi:hypothetical protein
MLENFGEEFKPVEVRRSEVGVLLNGEWMPGAEQAPETVSMIPIPITPAQLKNLPEGKYAAGDMRFYAKGPAVYKEGTVFEYKGVTYKLRDINDRDDHGSYTIYYAKREVEQSGVQ